MRRRRGHQSGQQAHRNWSGCAGRSQAEPSVATMRQPPFGAARGRGQPGAGGAGLRHSARDRQTRNGCSVRRRPAEAHRRLPRRRRDPHPFEETSPAPGASPSAGTKNKAPRGVEREGQRLQGPAAVNAGQASGRKGPSSATLRLRRRAALRMTRRPKWSLAIVITAPIRRWPWLRAVSGGGAGSGLPPGVGGSSTRSGPGHGRRLSQRNPGPRSAIRPRPVEARQQFRDAALAQAGD